MDDYRNKMCLLDGEYLAKCVSQDFLGRVLTFEVEPGGATFTRDGEWGVEVYEEKELRTEDVKHLLRRVESKE